MEKRPFCLGIFRSGFEEFFPEIVSFLKLHSILLIRYVILPLRFIIRGGSGGGDIGEN